MREEIKVVRIEAFADEPIQKVVYPRKGYAIRVKFVLEDGRTLPSSIREEKLKDLKVELASLPKDVNNKKVVVENGKITMSISTFSIGAGGMQERSV